MLGVKKAAIQKYENGGIVNLKTETVEKIADIFKVSPSYIMGWEKFDNKFDLDQIRLEIHAIKLIQDNIGDDALIVLGAMQVLCDEAKKRVKQYATDLCQIDMYVDIKKREQFKEKYPTGFLWTKSR